MFPNGTHGENAIPMETLRVFLVVRRVGEEASDGGKPNVGGVHPLPLPFLLSSFFPSTPSLPIALSLP